MNRRELVQATAAHGELDPKLVDRAIKAMTEVITSVNAKGEPVAISGFAKFARVDRAARMARNPATGAPVKVKASKKAKITALKGYKDGVMSISAAPKLAKGVWPTIPSAKPVARSAASSAPAAKKAAPAKSASATKKAPAKKAASAAPRKRR